MMEMYYQLGAAVAIVYLCLQGTRLVLEFAGKLPKATQIPIKIVLESDPTVMYRLNKLDNEMEERLRASEYEKRQADITEDLRRIESKLDNLWGARNSRKD